MQSQQTSGGSTAAEAARPPDIDRAHGETRQPPRSADVPRRPEDRRGIRAESRKGEKQFSVMYNSVSIHVRVENTNAVPVAPVELRRRDMVHTEQIRHLSRPLCLPVHNLPAVPAALPARIPDELRKERLVVPLREAELERPPPVAYEHLLRLPVAVRDYDLDNERLYALHVSRDLPVVYTCGGSARRPARAGPQSCPHDQPAGQWARAASRSSPHAHGGRPNDPWTGAGRSRDGASSSACTGTPRGGGREGGGARDENQGGEAGADAHWCCSTPPRDTARTPSPLRFHTRRTPSARAAPRWYRPGEAGGDGFTARI
ncbi:uncharacterized protein BXZ73DRAFT_78707 [Epithele typhae]|uniref:uncharacterized protein n=1 Tax=Epithele typhae TaxID=378194 RepID=UPI00200774D4|nr:uncharacterized protein BXZ73DRAFT_78707 [Epithele typhae]KAH9926611.1 hypothetical protein BXZ73DRAFT_78707 [Epithele typhae]